MCTGEADIGGVLYYATPERDRAFDFIRVFAERLTFFYNPLPSSLTTDNTTSLIKYSPTVTLPDLVNLSAIIVAFDSSVWLTILCALVFVSSMTALFEMLSFYCHSMPMSSGGRRRRDPTALKLVTPTRFVHTVIITAADTFGVMVNNTADVQFRSPAAKVLFTCWAWTCVLLSNTYTAQLTLSAVSGSANVAPFNDYATLQNSGYKMITSLLNDFNVKFLEGQQKSLLFESERATAGVERRVYYQKEAQILQEMLDEGKRERLHVVDAVQCGEQCLYDTVKSGQFPAHEQQTLREKYVSLALMSPIIISETRSCALRTVELTHAFPGDNNVYLAVPRPKMNVIEERRLHTPLHELLSNAVFKWGETGLMLNLMTIKFSSILQDAIRLSPTAQATPSEKPLVSTVGDCIGQDLKKALLIKSDSFYPDSVLALLRKKPATAGLKASSVKPTTLRDILPVFEVLMLAAILGVWVFGAEVMLHFLSACFSSESA